MNTYKIDDYLKSSNALNPSLSPSGNKIVYLSNDGYDSYQIWLFDSRNADEPKRITSDKDTISSAIFSPVSEDVIFFTKSSGGDEKYQIYTMELSTNQVTDLTHRPDVRHNLGAISRDGKWLLYASNKRNRTDFDTYRMNLETLESEIIFQPGGWSYGMSFSPTCRYAIVGTAQGIGDDDLFLIDFQNNSKPIHFTQHEDNATFYSPVWFEDESAFLAITSRDSDFLHVEKLMIADLSWSTVLEKPWDIETIAMTRQDDRLIANVNEDGQSTCYTYDVKNQRLENEELLTFNEDGITSVRWSQNGKKVAYTAVSYDSPLNVYVWDVIDNIHTPITKIASKVPAEVMVKPELIRFESFDGLKIPAYIYLPPHTNASNPVPVIVNIHGGPEGQFRPGFNTLNQYFVGQGYAVIAPNVRGSTGYGKKYQALDDRLKRLDSVKDLVWLHKRIAEDKRLDSEKVALLGASYGGYMVLAGLAFYPELWAAGIDIVGIANFITFLENTSPYRRKLREHEYGSLEEDYDFLKSVSPINSIDDVKAPLLLIHGANDPRVPLSEAEQVRDALQNNGVKAEMLVYPDEGHGIAKLNNRIDAYSKVAQFLEDTFSN
jgi:dipeptidyl aminopeptidase/acylaminoacyl peptidase